MPATQRSRVAIALGLLLLAVIAGLVAQRRALARSLIDSQLRSLGLEEVSSEVERFGLREFGVRNVRIGDQRGLSVDRIDAHNSRTGLLAGRLESVSVSGVRLRGAFEAGRVTFGALDPGLAAGDAASDGGVGPTALPARQIAIDDVEIAIETPEGLLSGGFAAELRQRDDRGIAADASAHAKHPRFQADLTFELDGTPDAFEGDLSLELRGIAHAAAGVAPAAQDAADRRDQRIRTTHRPRDRPAALPLCGR